MYKFSKIALSKNSCADEVVTIPKPTVVAQSPICPFDFHVTLTSDPPPLGVIQSASVWELATDNLFKSVVATIESSGPTMNEAFFPKKIIKGDSTYYLRAYTITNLGESVWSDTVTVETGFTGFTDPEVTEYGASSDNWWNQKAITYINNVPYAIQFDNGNSAINMFKHNGTSWWFLSNYGTTYNPYIDRVGARSPFNEWGSADIESFAFCDDGTNIYVTATLINASGLLIKIVLLKFDTQTETWSDYNLPNDGLFNRDAPGMFHRNGFLYFVGGYAVGADGKTISPTEDERTFFKFNLQTSELSPVTVNGALKPRDYRHTRIAQTDDGFYKFAGRGAPVGEHSSFTNAPELWYFSFVTNSWTAKSQFSKGDYLSDCFVGFDIAPTKDYLYAMFTPCQNTAMYDNGKIFLYRYSLDSMFWEPYVILDQPVMGYWFVSYATLKGDEAWFLYIEQGV